MASITTFPSSSSTPPLMPGQNGSANYRGSFAIMTSLFFMWGFMTVFNDILIPRFKEAFCASLDRQDDDILDLGAGRYY